MSDYYMTDDNDDAMLNWVEEHDKVCPFAKKNLVDRFDFKEEEHDNLCIVTVTCKCGEIKKVTICCKE